MRECFPSPHSSQQSAESREQSSSRAVVVRKTENRKQKIKNYTQKLGEKKRKTEKHDGEAEPRNSAEAQRKL